MVQAELYSYSSQFSCYHNLFLWVGPHDYLIVSSNFWRETSLYYPGLTAINFVSSFDRMHMAPIPLIDVHKVMQK